MRSLRSWAISIIADCCAKVIKQIAFEANLYDSGIVDYPGAKAASEQKKEILRALEIIKGAFV